MAIDMGSASTIIAVRGRGIVVDEPSVVAVNKVTGEVIVGYIGSERRSEYTAIGDTVNTSSRLESNARGGEILISDATAQAAHSRYKLKPRDPIMVKNRQQPVKLWEVDWQRASGAF
jgi:adenylate cyclase